MCQPCAVCQTNVCLFLCPVRACVARVTPESVPKKRRGVGGYGGAGGVRPRLLSSLTYKWQRERCVFLTQHLALKNEITKAPETSRQEELGESVGVSLAACFGGSGGQVAWPRSHPGNIAGICLQGRLLIGFRSLLIVKVAVLQIILNFSSVSHKLRTVSVLPSVLPSVFSALHCSFFPPLASVVYFTCFFFVHLSSCLAFMLSFSFSVRLPLSLRLSVSFSFSCSSILSPASRSSSHSFPPLSLPSPLSFSFSLPPPPPLLPLFSLSPLRSPSFIFSFPPSSPLPPPLLQTPLLL